jgi:hypothetical protein
MPTLKERYVDNKNSLQLLQLLVNNQSTLGKSTITSSNKHPWNQPPPQLCQQGNEPRANRLRARDLLRDFERDGHEVYNSRQSNLGAALAALNYLEDSTAVRRLQANVHVAAAQIEKEDLDTVDLQQLLIPGEDWNILANDVAATVPLSR